MEEISQKSAEIGSNKSFSFSNLIVVAVFFFITGALISGAIVFWSQKQMLKAASEEVKQCTKLKADYDKTKFGTTKSGINWNGKLLLSKDYGKFKVGAFDVSDLLENVFIVAPIDNNGLPTTYNRSFALSFTIYGIGGYNLFDVVGDKIYVLNQNGSFINVYTMSFSDKTAVTPAFYTMNNIGSISGPKYAVGVPYSINCQNNLCQIETAFHQESGCEMKLNLETKQYTGIKCSSMGGDFNPEPL